MKKQNTILCVSCKLLQDKEEFDLTQAASNKDIYNE